MLDVDPADESPPPRPRRETGGGSEGVGLLDRFRWGDKGLHIRSHIAGGRASGSERLIQ